ncbi:hypothetical protein HBA55_25270 [Pseudomaricurvus alkylphenolicus]|uniref:hypothetical protein n=1 Tax=Pseudomaricurvus alkylphenolicus TaxID=1306991 RepID=UPI0014210DA7|nr:hypothetical protein [Pseudomaricurvus alkylphenolicus]NIB42943.1 hypothetical protein [Pseudomaricurvus alkylphenolicus]
MPLKHLALLASALPFVAVHLCYLLSAWQGHVDWCVPYLQGCTSISGGGRHGAAYFVFKGLMIPAAVVMGAYWFCYSQWLKLLGDDSEAQRRTLIVLGVVASLGLILYTCVLGSIGDIYRTQRRIGVILYFGLTYVAQLLATRRLARLNITELAGVYQSQLVVCLLMLLLGLANLFCEIFYDHYDELDDIFEWNFALLMIIFYFISYWGWGRTAGVLKVQLERWPLGR